MIHNLVDVLVGTIHPDVILRAHMRVRVRLAVTVTVTLRATVTVTVRMRVMVQVMTARALLQRGPQNC